MRRADSATSGGRPRTGRAYRSPGDDRRAAARDLDRHDGSAGDLRASHCARYDSGTHNVRPDQSTNVRADGAANSRTNKSTRDGGGHGGSSSVLPHLHDRKGVRE